jgi:hypothetical protein
VDGMSLVLIGLSAWVAALTLVVVLLVRQIAILTLRLDAGQTQFAPADDGLDVGTVLSEEVIEAMPELRDPLSYLLVLSASCNPCRELAEDLRGWEFEVPVVALVAGREELASGIAGLMPSSVRTVTDPEASDLAREHLSIVSAPFALQVEGGMITGKAYLHSSAHLAELIEARRTQATSLVDAPEVV